MTRPRTGGQGGRGDKNSSSAGLPHLEADPDIGNRHRVDFRVIRDATRCYLYSSDDNGRLSRAGTTIGEFPKGFRSTQ